MICTHPNLEDRCVNGDPFPAKDSGPKLSSLIAGATWCKQRGVEPEQTYSATPSLRIAPGLHRRVAERAAKAGASINQFIADRLGEAA
ncbi:MAG: toxin-antitoxin system HicB family antitoxin [Methylocella sp.]